MLLILDIISIAQVVKLLWFQAIVSTHIMCT